MKKLIMITTILVNSLFITKVYATLGENKKQSNCQTTKSSSEGSHVPIDENMNSDQDFTDMAEVMRLRKWQKLIVNNH